MARSEEEISKHNLPINAPIRIHKYNIDELENSNESDQDSDSSSASSQEDSDESESQENANDGDNDLSVESNLVKRGVAEPIYSSSRLLLNFYNYY